MDGPLTDCHLLLAYLGRIVFSVTVIQRVPVITHDPQLGNSYSEFAYNILKTYNLVFFRAFESRVLKHIENINIIGVSVLYYIPLSC